jgi:hypothetical protein
MKRRTGPTPLAASATGGAPTFLFPRNTPQEPTDKFALTFTRNAFPGAPIRVGRKRINEAKIQAVVVNNKVRARETHDRHGPSPGHARPC